jgi:hypothetical protein
MNTPRFAAVLISALAAAPAFSQTAPLTPISMGPAAAGQCIIGSEGCGLARGALFDPVAEDALVGLGQRAVLTLRTESPRQIATEKPAPLAAPKPQDASDAANSGTDVFAIGGQIINPLGGAAPLRGATTMNLGASASASARQATFDTHLDASGTAPAPVAKATGLSYVQSQKVEAALTGKAAAFGSDPKLSAGDADFSAGGFGASSNR